MGLGGLWTIVWFAIALGSLIIVRQSGNAAILCKLPWLFAIVGLLVFYYLPGGFRWMGFTVFLCATIVLGFQHRHAEASK